MASKIVEVPGIGNVEFPDSMSDEQVSAAIKKQIRPNFAANPPKVPRPSLPIMQGAGYQSVPEEQTPEGHQAAIIKRESQEGPIGQVGIGIGKAGGMLPLADSLARLASGDQERPDLTARGKLQTAGKVGGIAAGIVPSIVGAPVATLAALGGGTIAQQIGSKVAEASGASPNVQDVAGDVSGLIGGGLVSRMGLSAAKPLTEPARALTKAVNPPPTEWNSYIKAAEEQTGNIVQHAKENNLPLDTKLDFARAAKSAADESRDYFQNDVLKPVQNAKVQVGQDYKTLGDINKRIGQINNELRPSYIKKEGGQVLTAVANEADLVAEKNALTKALHEGIAKTTGIPAEDVAALRQRFGAQYTIADQTLAAENQRSSAVGRASEGAPLPTERMGLAREAINYARGGREAISDRAFKKVIDKMPSNHSPLPPIPASVSVSPKARLPLYRSLNPEQPTLAEPVDTAIPETVLNKLTLRRATNANRRILKEQTRAVKRADNPTRRNF